MIEIEQMKYQITCDNCGTQFIVEANEGQTIECQCPHCHGTMEVTLPLISAGQQYQPRNQVNAQVPQTAHTNTKNNHAILWGILIGLVVLAIGIGAYVAFRPTPPAAVASDSLSVDTIPYEAPVQSTAPPVVDTVVTAPEPEEPEEEATPAPKEEKQQADTTAVEEEHRQ